MEDLNNEPDLDMTEVCPPVPPATREAPAAEPGVGVEGWAEGNPATPSVSPGRADCGSINDSSSSSSSSDDSHTSSDSSNSSNSSNSNDSGDFPALVERPAWDLEIFRKLPALLSGRTRSLSRGLTTSASCADALLAYAIRTVEAKRTVEAWRTVEAKRAVEEEAAEIE